MLWHSPALAGPIHYSPSTILWTGEGQVFNDLPLGEGKFHRAISKRGEPTLVWPHVWVFQRPFETELVCAARY
jgi:hypothetical protein